MPLKIRVVLSTSKESKISGNRNICPEDLDARGMAGLAQIESFETDEKPKSAGGAPRVDSLLCPLLFYWLTFYKLRRDGLWGKLGLGISL